MFRSGFAPGILKSALLWWFVRSGSLVMMFLVMGTAWGRWRIPDINTPDPLMYTNLGNILFWVIWIMGLVMMAPLAGRAWCAVCPMGALNEWIARWGLKASFPKALRNDYLKALALFSTVLLLGIGRIHHYPAATGYYLAGWLLVAVIMGFIFSGRSLCQRLCPIGGMLGLYGRCAPVEISVRNQTVCNDCEGKECVKGSSTLITGGLGRIRSKLRLRRHPCPVNLRVWDMMGTDRCLMCFNCMRICPYDNVAVNFRRPVSALWNDGYPRYSETLLTASLTGFIVLSYLRFWPSMAALVAKPVSYLSPFTGVAGSRLVFIMWTGIALPLLVLFLPAALTFWSRVVKGNGTAEDVRIEDRSPAFKVWIEPSSVRETVNDDPGADEEVMGTDTLKGLVAAFSPSVIPVVLSGHLVLALVKLSAKTGYLPLAIADPPGMRTYLAIEELGLVPRPGFIVPMAGIKIAAVCLVAAGLWFSIRVVFKIAGREGVSGTVFTLPSLLAGLVIAGGISKWLF